MKAGLMLAAGGGILAALAVLAVYWPARHNGFIWDDLSYLVASPAYRDPALWQEALFHPPTGDAVFRPLALLSYALPMWFGLTSPVSHHIENFLIHAGNVLLITLLAWRMFGRDFRRAAGGAAGAALCGLAYGLHPALTESVIWIACRFDLMMAFFLLLALLVDCAWTEAGWKRATAVSLLFLAAALCKETAVGFLLALPAVHLALDRTQRGPLRPGTAMQVWAPHYRVYAGLLLACTVYLLLRFAVLGASLGTPRVMARFDEIGSLGQHALVVAASLTEYISDVIWLFANVAPNRVLVLPVASAARIVPALVGVCGVVLVAWGAMRFTAAGRVACLLVLAFFASLLPLSNILPAPTYPGELQIAARYVTFPLTFICLAVCALLPVLARRLAACHVLVRGLPWLAGAAWIAISVASVRAIIPLWQDEGIFFRWAIARAPPNSWPYLYMNLGGYYLNAQDLPQARDAFARAVAARSRSRWVASLAWYNLGNVEARLGNPEPAISALQAALDIDPDNVYGRARLAEVERERGRPEVAVEVAAVGLQRLQAAGRSHPHVDLLHYQLGLAYTALARHDEAASQLTAALAATRDPAARASAEQALQAARDAGKNLAGP